MALVLDAGSQAADWERLPKDTGEKWFLNLPTSAPGPKSAERAHCPSISFQSYALVQDKLGFLESLTPSSKSPPACCALTRDPELLHRAQSRRDLGEDFQLDGSFSEVTPQALLRTSFCLP